MANHDLFLALQQLAQQRGITVEAAITQFVSVRQIQELGTQRGLSLRQMTIHSAFQSQVLARGVKAPRMPLLEDVRAGGLTFITKASVEKWLDAQETKQLHPPEKNLKRRKGAKNNKIDKE